MTDTLSAVIDLETLGTKPGSVVLSAGITVFDRDKQQSFDELVTQGIEIHFDIEVQFERGLRSDPKTIQWWSEQAPEALAALQDRPKIHPRDFYEALEPLGNLHTLQKMRWYARGPSFDHSILDAMLDQFNVTPPYKFWMQRCTRTFCDEKGIEKHHIDLNRPSQMTAHCALHDAAYDAWLIQHHQEITHAP
jgi:hypothetical protein